MRILNTDIGIGAIASLVFGGCDMIWLSHDIYTNGFSVMYMLIAIGFVLGTVGLAYSLNKHHKELARYRKQALYDYEGRTGD